MYLIHYIQNAFKLIKRDMILITFGAFVLYMAVVLHFLLPWLNRYLAEQGFLPGQAVAHHFSHYYPVILSNFLLYTGALMGGAVFGFLILTEKDDNTLTAMLVSPISPRQYIQSRVIITAAASFLIILFLFYGVTLELLPFGQMLLIALGGALTGPLVMLYLAIMANSKLQGMNYAKILSFVGFLIIIGYFIPEPFQWIFGLFPPYWVSKAYWAALDGGGFWYLYLTLGIVLQGAAILWLAKVFIRRVYRRV